MICIIKWAVVETLIYSVRVKSRVSRFLLFRKNLIIFSKKFFEWRKLLFFSNEAHISSERDDTHVSHCHTTTTMHILYLIIIIMIIITYELVSVIIANNKAVPTVPAGSK